MIGIISDIHGNSVALKAVLIQLKQLQVNKIVCLGDIAGYYCDINECCDILREEEIFSLMGNHDWYLANDLQCPRSNSANKCLEYQKSVISKENLKWLSSLKSADTIYDINCVHGGWLDPLDEYVIPSDQYFSSLEGSFFASGHTHVPFVWQDKTKAYCNPGSVGQPRDGNPDASFAVFKNSLFTIKRVAYDIKLMQTKMATAGFESYFYENLEVGARIGGKIDCI